jgi:hypothetical protein
VVRRKTRNHLGNSRVGTSSVAFEGVYFYFFKYIYATFEQKAPCFLRIRKKKPAKRKP